MRATEPERIGRAAEMVGFGKVNASHDWR